MNTERLTLLANFLATVPPNKFDIAEWRAADCAYEYSEWQYLQDAKLKQIECDTTGCAIGWACVIPEFNKDGFKWDAKSMSPILKPDGQDRISSWDAVTAFFGITRDQAEELFSWPFYINPEHEVDPKHHEEPTLTNVIARIRKLIAQQDCNSDATADKTPLQN